MRFCVTDSICDVTKVVHEFSVAHNIVRFTAEVGWDSEISFQNDLLARKENEYIQLSIFTKKTWAGQYRKFNSFVPTEHGRNLTKWLGSTAVKTCSPRPNWISLASLLMFFEAKTTRRSTLVARKLEMFVAERKELFISLRFKGDCLTTIRSIFNAETFRCSLRDTPKINIQAD